MRMDRSTALWAIVLFFGATLVFAGVHRLTEDESAAVTLGAQVAALVVVVGLVVFVVRRLE